MKGRLLLSTRLLATLIVVILALNTYSQCTIFAPTGTDGCSYAGGSVELVANGSSGYYAWYTAATGGSLVSTDSVFNTPWINTNTTYYLAATDTASGLSFDGTNDYIALDHSFTNVGEITALTAEAWVKTSFSGGGSFDNWSIIDFDRSEYFNLFVRGDNGEVGFSTTGDTGTINDFYSTGVSVNDGNWHHIAGVFDGTDKVIIIDGVEVARRTNPHGGLNIGTGVNRFGFIGDGSEAGTFNSSRNNIYYQGLIDEVRMWNVARTATQISSLKDSCLQTTPAGLVLYYPMNENTGDSIFNAAGIGSNGRMFNFNLTNAWVRGGLVSCTCESSRVPVEASIGSSSLVSARLDCNSSSQTLDAGSGYPSYLWSTGASTQTINASQAGIYSVTVSGGACNGSKSVSVVGNQHSGNSLLFDGSNDYGAISNLSYSSTGHSELTVETWLKTTDGSNQMIASFDRTEYWRLEVNGAGAGTGRIGFDISTSSGVTDFGGSIRIDDGNWHHVAAVFDNGAMRIYIDGQLDATRATGATFGSGLLRYGFLGVGSEASSFNGTTGPNDYFNGELDEFRVWNVARTQTQIRDNMIRQVNPNSTGLQLYYKFDETGGSTLNDYETVRDYATTLFNFSGSYFVNSGAPLGDSVAYLYPGSWAGQSISANGCGGESLTLSNLSGSANGAHVYFVNSLPNSVAGIPGIGANNRYFGVFKANGSAATYTATYNYEGNPFINPVNTENTLLLRSRSDGSILTWAGTTATLDTAANTLVTTAISTEFMLGSNEFPLPVELTQFSATPNSKENTVNLFWITTSELNNDYFTVEKTKDLEAFEEVETVTGQGTTNSKTEYNTTDFSPYKGVSYYRLSQTDFDGTTNYFDLEKVMLAMDPELDMDVQLYPNPNNGHHMFIKVPAQDNNVGSDEVKLLVNDFLGKEFLVDFSVFDKGDHQLIVIEMNQKLTPGSYMVNMQIGNKRLSHKLIVQ